MLFFLFLSSLLNYLDRIALSVVAPQIRSQLGLTNLDYAWVLGSFLAMYALFCVLGGRLADSLGSIQTLYLSIACWSVASILHSSVFSLTHLILVRGLLGIGEACFYPAALRLVGERFPPRYRAKATSFLVLGMGVGITLTTPLVSVIAGWAGWRSMFVVTGSAGLVLLLGWKFQTQQDSAHARTFNPGTPAKTEPSGGSAEPIQQSSPPPPFFGNRNLWMLLIARSLGDAVWFFYIFWLPQYLVQSRGFSLLDLGSLGWIPFFMADLGALGGGWISTRLISSGCQVLAARKILLLASAALIPMGIIAALVVNHWMALVLMGVALWGIMSYGTTVMALPADLFPVQRIGMVAGLCGFAGSLSGAGFQGVVGWLLDYHGYFPVFLLAGCLHPLAALLLTFFLRPTADLGPVDESISS